MKWFFHICMCLSAAFLLWTSGGTGWNSSSSSDIKLLSVLEHSLSKIWIFGFTPISLSVFCITLYSLVSSVPFLDLVVLLLMSQGTNLFGSYISWTKIPSPTKILCLTVCEVYLAPTKKLLVFLSATDSFHYLGKGICCNFGLYSVFYLGFLHGLH